MRFYIFSLLLYFLFKSSYAENGFNCSLSITGERMVTRYSTHVYSYNLVPSRWCKLSYESFLFKINSNKLSENITIHSNDTFCNLAHNFYTDNLDFLDLEISVIGLERVDEFFDYDNVLNSYLFDRLEGALLLVDIVNISISDAFKTEIILNKIEHNRNNTYTTIKEKPVDFVCNTNEHFPYANITYYWNISGFEAITTDNVFNYTFNDIGRFVYSVTVEVVVFDKNFRDKIIKTLYNNGSIPKVIYVKEKVANLIVEKNPSLVKNIIFEVILNFTGSGPFVCTLNASLQSPRRYDLKTIATDENMAKFISQFNEATFLHYNACVSNYVSTACQYFNITVHDYPIDARSAPFILTFSCFLISLLCFGILATLLRLSTSRVAIETANFDFQRSTGSTESRSFKKFNHRLCARTKQFFDKIKENLSSGRNYELVQYSSSRSERNRVLIRKGEGSRSNYA